MAEKTEILQLMLDAIVDADSLEKFINGSDSETVLTRLSAEYPTLQKALKELFENGGIAGRFRTLVELQSSPLSDGAYALVADDVDYKNGIYIKNNGAWAKSKSDVFGKVTEYLSDVQKKAAVSVIDLSTDKNTVSHTAVLNVSGSLRWDINASDYTAVVLPVSSGDIYKVTELLGGAVVVALFNSKLLDLSKLKPLELVNPYNTKVIVINKHESKLIAITKDFDRMHVGVNFRGVSQKSLLQKITGLPVTSSNLVQNLADSTPSLPPSSELLKQIHNEVVSNRISINTKVTAVKGAVSVVDTSAAAELKLSVYRSQSSPTGLVWQNNEHKFFSGKDRTLAVPIDASDRGKFIRVKASAVKPLSFIGFSSKYLPTNSQHTAAFNVVIINKGEEDVVRIPDYAEYILLSKSNANDPDILPELVEIFEAEDVLVSANNISDFLPKTSESNLPDVIHHKNIKTTVFAAYKNFILKDEMIDGVSHIMVSKDVGKTWTQFENTIGKITNFHIFVDGSIMLCGINKVYTLTDDYTGLLESTVYDHDGSVFTGSEINNYFTLNVGNQIQYVGDTEMFVWGEYAFSGDTRMWYTTDRGKTVKCAIKSGTTVIGSAGAHRFRHFHMITQRKQDEKFYIGVGDNGAESAIFRGTYNVDSDSWEWDFYNKGDAYKFGDIFFDDYYAYLLTDYTAGSVKGNTGLYRVAIENLGDISKYHNLYNPGLQALGIAAFSRYLEDRNGNKIILPDSGGAGKLWVARQGVDFKLHYLEPKINFMLRLGVDDNGNIYTNDVFQNPDFPWGNNNLYINHGSYNATQIMRDAGLTNFMQDNLITDSLQGVSRT